MLTDSRILDEDLISRVDGQRQHIDTVAAVHRLEGLIIDAGRVEHISAPLVRLILTSGGLGGEEIGSVHRQQEGHRTVAAERTGMEALQLDGAVGGRDGVEAILGIVFTLADGVIEGCLLRLVHGQLQFEDVGAAIAVRHGIGVMAGSIELLSTPYIRQLAGAYRSRIELMIGRVHRQGQRVDAVATAHRLQAVGIDTAGGQALAMPVVRRLVGTERHRLRVAVGRVHQQGVLMDAVAAICCLQVQRVGLSRIEGVAAPYVRQRALAYRHRVIEVVGRVHDGIHHIYIVAALGVHHRVAVLAGSGDGVAAPGLRHALAQLDGIVGEDLRLVHGQRQGIDTVAAVHGLQAVVVGARGGQTLTVPGVRQVVAAHVGRLAEAVGRVHRQGQRVDAVAAT